MDECEHIYICIDVDVGVMKTDAKHHSRPWFQQKTETGAYVAGVQHSAARRDFWMHMRIQ